MKFGSPEYFQLLDAQVMAHLGALVASGAMNHSQVPAEHDKAMRRGVKKVKRFYGQTSKYDGRGRLKA